MNIYAQTMGRAKTVLVFGQGEQAKAVLSAIVVCTLDETGTDRLSFTGPVGFADSVRDHIAEIILPIVDRILTCLQLSPKNFEISAVNLGAASARDVGANISGFSTDVPILLALLSAGLQIPVPEDIVATGHIASVGGDIRSVKSIPAKLDAAKGDRTVRRFIYPDLDRDRSMSTLTPREEQLIFEAVMAARDQMQIDAAGGIGELVRSVFTDEDIVLASLHQGFYNLENPSTPGNHPVDETIRYLAQANNQRFWKALERSLLAGQCQHGKELLQAFTQFHIDRREYAHNLGTKLMQLVRSLPPAVRRLKIIFPILDTGLCIKLSQFAGESDYRDVWGLFDAAHGRLIGHEPDISAEDTAPQPKVSDSDSVVFDAVISQINQQALAQKFAVPIDSARGSYVLDSSTVASYDQFLDTIEAFYVHLQRYAGSQAAESVDQKATRAEGLALLERTFQTQGGSQAASARATDGTGGGMRRILDALTEQYKNDQQAQFIQRIFKDALDGLDWDERVGFMQSILNRLGPNLPAEIRSQPPERFARHYEVIVQAYVTSWDSVNQLLRTM